MPILKPKQKKERKCVTVDTEGEKVHLSKKDKFLTSVTKLTTSSSKARKELNIESEDIKIKEKFLSPGIKINYLIDSEHAIFAAVRYLLI